MWPDEIRNPDFSVEVGDVKDAEVKMAHMLVETLAGDFDASEFEDDYAEAVETLVKTKIEGGEIKRTPTSTKTSGEVVDLLAALQRSVDAAKNARGETGSEIFDDLDDEDEKPAKKSAAKKTAKSAAKKTTTSAAAKKTGTAKTAAKKSGTAKSAAKKTTTKKATTKTAAKRTTKTAARKAS
jgi:DNA end-binding protein Ku